MSQHSEIIRKAIVKAIALTLDKVYSESQRVVPVKTGYLKSTGKVSYDDNGGVITYSAEYASFVERGWKGGIVWVDSYTRSGGVVVRGHYTNQPYREGKHYIENPLRENFKTATTTMTPFQGFVLDELKGHYNNVTVV